jgi:hypothetical protein
LDNVKATKTPPKGGVFVMVDLFIMLHIIESMKKILGLLIVTAVFVLINLFTSVVRAEVVVDQPLFSIGNISISKLFANSEARVNFSPINIINEQNIGYWRVRVYCEGGATVKFADGAAACGKAILVPNTDKDAFSIFAKNKSEELSRFYFKLKAYDKNGKWLHTETKGFKIK